jgi:predicted nucleic acid-binding protein
MILAITDANIFIDLIHLDLLSHFFKLNLEFHTSLEVYDQLLEEQALQLDLYINSKQLKMHSSTEQEILEMQKMNFHKGLELADRTIFYHAKRLNSIVLSGDNLLRKFCSGQQLDVRGIIWLFDELLEQGILDSNTLVTKMELLLKTNSRLPRKECLSRIEKWKKF